MPAPHTRESPAWGRAKLDPRFRKICDEPTQAGQGIHGAVVKAWDAKADCYVAVKKSHKAAKGGVAGRARRVHALLDGLHHPCILRALGHGRRDAGDPARDRSYLVTEWIDGGCVAHVGLGEDPAGLTLQVLQALAHMHRQGVVHGDLHAENILRSGARPVIIDFDRANGRDQAPEPDALKRDLRAALAALETSACPPSRRAALQRFAECPLARAWREGCPPADDAVHAAWRIAASQHGPETAALPCKARTSPESTFSEGSRSGEGRARRRSRFETL